MKKILAILGIISMLFSASPALAAVIVDTGTPPGTGGSVLASYQWLAGEFNLSQAYTLNDILGYLQPFYNGGTLTLAIYADGGDVPDKNNELFSGGFSVPSDPNVPDWHGLSGLNWYLPAGSYWAAFEVRGGQTFAGGMPFPAPSPLGNYAFVWPDDGIGYRAAPLNFGLRINGTQGGQPIIPEPATLSLLGLGLVGLVRLRRKV